MLVPQLVEPMLKLPWLGHGVPEYWARSGASSFTIPARSFMGNWLDSICEMLVSGSVTKGTSP